MKKRLVSTLLALCMVLALLPKTAQAADTLQDWYFLFAIFKNVDADCADGKGMTTHTKSAMSQGEIELVKAKIESFEAYMNSTGVMRAHVDTIEIDETITELEASSASTLGSYLGAEQATPLLENAGVNLDRYDFVSCYTSLNVATVYGGLNSARYENGTGHSCFNLRNIEFAQPDHVSVFPGTSCVHEFLHFMEKESKRWGTTFDLHSVREQFYASDQFKGGWEAYHYKDGWEACYTDIILNRIEGDVELGTGVNPAVWQYPPHVLRTMRELTIPDGVADIGRTAFYECAGLKNVTIPTSVTSISEWAFGHCSSLENVTIPASVTEIGNAVFYGCSSLESVTLPDGITRISPAMFCDCTSLTSVTIPAGVTSIGDTAFHNTNLKDVYFGGTEMQWKAMEIDEYNSPLTKAAIHYGGAVTSNPTTSASLTKFADVSATSPFVDAINWAVEKNLTTGKTSTTFAPGEECTNGQILTFLWRANGSPEPTIDNPFTDSIPASFQKAAVWAYEKGLVSGAAFASSTPCTRAVTVEYLWKTAGSPAVSGNASFTDVPANADYAQAVAWAVENGVTSGTGNGQFSPTATCTRGQIVTFLYRAMGK